MLTVFGIIGFIILLIFAVIGYFALGITVSIFNDPSLGEVFINKYMDYLIRKYPEKYYKDETGFYWVNDCSYGAHAMSSDKKVKEFTNIIYTVLFILWPIDLFYKIIKIFKHNTYE